MKAAQDRQAIYANNWRRTLEFQVGDFVFLKVSPFRGTMRFGRKGKLAPRYIGPYKIIEKIGILAYRLNLPQSLYAIHDVLDCKEKQLRNKTIRLVMVEWSRHGREEATWKLESRMRQEWPHLFDSVMTYSMYSDFPMYYHW
ncbi:uncharacterized protein [Henckelia pumila]|uniref:uncharacterized protein n=1 Tax=Henckelia pumila TaxID=405737 RepID=UPI003C6E897E